MHGSVPSTVGAALNGPSPHWRLFIDMPGPQITGILDWTLKLDPEVRPKLGFHM